MAVAWINEIKLVLSEVIKILMLLKRIVNKNHLEKVQNAVGKFITANSMGL